MCGIAGHLDWTGSGIDRELLARMIATLHHRGPDGHDFYVDSVAGLAHARLSIIDLAGGTQPLCNEDRTLWITFNGEIFNYIELREQLIACGHQFATRSDTEVILHAYEEYGAACVEHFNGQWAFAIWDNQRRELFLSRDRYGKRPLFYTRQGSRFWFGSEIKALFADSRIPRQIDLEALDQIFTFWCPIAPRSGFAGINELPPGHSARVTATETRLIPYWRPEYHPESPTTTLDQMAGPLRERLIAATRLRLRADVPIGAYLSGGLDSSVTTALIRQTSETRLCTFSVGFADAEFDETTFQQEVSQLLQTEHTQQLCTGADIANVFPDVIRHVERPILRTAPAPLYLLSRAVHQAGIKVVLTGEGADEVLGGYDLFKEAKLRRFWARRPESTIRPQLLGRLYPYLRNVQAQSQTYLQAFFQVRPEELAKPSFSHLPRWQLTQHIRQFYAADVRSALRDYDPVAELEANLPTEFASWHPFCQSQYLEATVLLPGYILSSQGDRMSMAHSVEGRCPFLDPQLADWAGDLPVRFKMCGLNEKALLKEAARGLVPDRILARSKQPYRAPDAHAFLPPGQPVADYVVDQLSEQKLQQTGLFEPTAVRKLVQKVHSGRPISTKDNMALVGILSTQLVADQLLRPAASPSAEHSQLTAAAFASTDFQTV